MVPSFNGEDTNLTSRQWVKIVEEIGQAENWNCQDKRFQMISKFVGTPKEWLLKQDCFGENWNRLKRTFVRAFPSDMDYHNLLKRMVIRTKTDSETYSNYFTFKTMLLKSCNITGRKAISCLIGGFMDEDLKNLAYDQNFETAEALYSFLMKQEQFKKSRPKPPEELIANFSKVCYGCNMNGHLFEDCSDNPKNKVSGHVMINPKNFVDVWINGYSVQAYNDISSHFVMIREDQAKSMNINYKYNTKMICGYKGNPVTTLGEVSIAIRVNAVTVNIDAFIVPSSAEDFGVILGDNLRNHPDICYEENPNSISFSSAVITHTERSSFSMNEELMKNINDMNGSSKGVQRNRHHRGKPEKHERQQQSQFEPPFGSSSTSRHYRYN
ncbi:PREDICTED: uncharacterized protein LOC108566948 [Nicrophorus vespilloides]|uniref:Uncharacterized protein LOC108566948 n=1 Tax=Nicrophorus vespilloides TaxID=110193 RepID=A0ABM1N6Z2_NICVS|nr:PREDICTED: uncharacterized protein LOC108566948 [Nicrophorus vespilloides]XP_017782592.1 PREDICTED: uncharacterized protein LOC108566948 [Nicrophorus vespilloides]